MDGASTAARLDQDGYAIRLAVDPAHVGRLKALAREADVPVGVGLIGLLALALDVADGDPERAARYVEEAAAARRQSHRERGRLGAQQRWASAT